MISLQQLSQAKFIAALSLLVVFWCWETWRPFFGWRACGRNRHATRNLTIAITNALVLGIVFGTATILIADWTTRRGFGLLNLFQLPDAARFVLALILLDACMYAWHWANHAIPFLWRFHRMHHSDTKMDVTTAARFHLGELAIGIVLRLGLIATLGFQICQIVAYEMLVIATTQFHHADISLGRWDRPLRWLFVTPDMHKVHHSRREEETNSNYSTVLSLWDRIAATFRAQADPKTIEFGLDEFREDDWQTVFGLWKTPFVRRQTPPHDEARPGEN